MPRKILYCTKHLEGPLDVWYDCSKCEQGPKEEALKHVRWMDKNQIKKLSLLQSLAPERLVRVRFNDETLIKAC